MKRVNNGHTIILRLYIHIYVYKYILNKNLQNLIKKETVQLAGNIYGEAI